MANKLYKGLSGRFGGRVTVDGKTLNPRFDLCSHSPTGFNWGYGGSGPAQLALAILADHLGDDQQAVALHQKFKWGVVAQMPIDELWELTSDEVDLALHQLELRGAL